MYTKLGDRVQQGLAPTAGNQQKFEIILNDDDSVTIEDKGMFLSKIDKGIVTYHFEAGSGKKYLNKAEDRI